MNLRQQANTENLRQRAILSLQAKVADDMPEGQYLDKHGKVAFNRLEKYLIKHFYGSKSHFDNVMVYEIGKFTGGLKLVI